MPRFRATISGSELADVDSRLRDARVGVVVSRDVEDATTASGVPTEAPEVDSVDVSIDGDSAEDAETKVREALGDGYEVEIVDG
jgi:hypothetical protein